MRATERAVEQSMFEQIGRYEILELIGEGSMAEVYKAYDPEIDRTLALKILKQEWCLDEEYVGRFIREAKAAGAFSHPNIVTVYDIGKVENRPYIIIELINGAPLGETMKPGKPLPLKQVLSIGIQMADALDYAHRHGVVHRDVKPANILALANSETIKIADFGIAHIDDPNSAQQTQVGAVLGTPQYMSPEQVMGQKVDGRSDLFSLGVILYQLCTGQRPFDGDTMATLLYKITKDDPPPIAQLDPGTPAGLQHIVNKLLAKAPERRFQSGEELAKALRHELKALQELSRDADKQRYIPIRVRSTLLMGTLVALTMAVSVFFIEDKQNEALTRFAIDSGASLAKFIATETAVPVLSQDWVSIEIDIQEASQRQTFEYLFVLDHQGIVRGASDSALLGKTYSEPEITELLFDDGDDDSVRVVVVGQSGGAAVLDFDTPILFQGKEVGRIRLGLLQTSLQEVVDITRILLIALSVVTVLAVGIGSYVLARLLSRPIKALRAALNEIRDGNLDCRISEERRDELGEVFAEFNKMAASLEARNNSDLMETDVSEPTTTDASEPAATDVSEPAAADASEPTTT
jgi:serine/threonine-protein kinase